MRNEPRDPQMPDPFSPRRPKSKTTENKDFGSPTGMKILAFLMRILPLRFVYAVAMIPVIWYYVTKPQGRSSSRIYQKMLGLTHGPLRSFFFGLAQARAFSHVILDNMYLGLFGADRFHIEESGTEIFRGALSSGKGLILLSAHVGNWHLAINFLGNTRTKVHLVTDELRHKEVQRQMDRAKESSDHLVIHNQVSDPGLIFELRHALSRGEVVILAGDRATAKGRRTLIPFLAGNAWFPTNPFALAEATGAPVCTALTFRKGMQRYVCYGIGPFNPDDLNPTTNKSQRAENMARHFARDLEEHLRKFPEQWFNFYNFWQDTSD